MRTNHLENLLWALYRYEMGSSLSLNAIEEEFEQLFESLKEGEPPKITEAILSYIENHIEVTK